MGFYSQIEKITSSISSHKYTNANAKETVTRLHEAIRHGNDSKSIPLHSTVMQGLRGDGNWVDTDWKTLAASSLTDLDVNDLDQALFLFALRKIQKTPAVDVREVWKRYAPFWKRRLLPEAFRMVAGIYSQACSEVDVDTSR